MQYGKLRRPTLKATVVTIVAMPVTQAELNFQWPALHGQVIE